MEVNYSILGARLRRRARQIEAVKRVRGSEWARRISEQFSDPDLRAWVASILLWDCHFEAGEALAAFFDDYPRENDHGVDELLAALRSIRYPDATLRASQKARQGAPLTDQRRQRRGGFRYVGPRTATNSPKV